MKTTLSQIESIKSLIEKAEGNAFNSLGQRANGTLVIEIHGRFETFKYLVADDGNYRDTETGEGTY